jgi:hypothetical protein
MRILNIRTGIGALILLAFSGAGNSAFSQNVTIVQDSRFEQLLNEKRRINPSITVNDRFKIQVAYGDNDKTRKALSDFRRDFKNIDATIVFESPTYKVWAGNFGSRIEAERNLVEIRKKYPYALLIKPNK